MDLREERRRMIRQDLYARGIRDPRVLDVMGRIHRELFVGATDEHAAYSDRALPIACGQTISQPYIVALMTEALQLSGGEHILEIGTGSGYQTAVLAELAREVTTIERFEHLSQHAAQLLRSLGYKNIHFYVGDGALGVPERSPYDGILITAASAEIPAPLWNHLREEGRVVGPFGSENEQWLDVIQKHRGQPIRTSLVPCRFVPFVMTGEAVEAEDDLARPDDV